MTTNTEELTTTHGHRNEVWLVGRMAGLAKEREMPSGTLLVSFRVVVRRDNVMPGPSFDALDCIVWDGRVQRVVRDWVAGDLVEVRGALRRRFWRAVSGSVSRCEIEVGVARRLAQAAPETIRRRGPRTLSCAAQPILAQRPERLVVSALVLPP
jgi:single-strand DNA-binding protein